MKSLRRIYVDFHATDDANRVLISHRKDVTRPGRRGPVKEGERVVIYDETTETDAVVVRWGDYLVAKIEGANRKRSRKARSGSKEQRTA